MKYQQLIKKLKKAMESLEKNKCQVCGGPRNTFIMDAETEIYEVYEELCLRAGVGPDDF